MYGIGILLGMLLLWRISRGEQVILENDEHTIGLSLDGNFPVSPLGEVEALLNDQGLKRQPGELFSTWFKRIGHQELLSILPLHNKLRFHPLGLTKAESTELQLAIKSATSQLQTHYQEVGKTD